MIQLIDTLQLGGAEKLAVTITNVLAKELNSSLGVTRHDGPLSALVQEPAKIFFFSKRHFLDIQAYWRLIRTIKENKIQVIHAHGPSLYMAVVVKWITNVGLVWHIHHGDYSRRPAKLTTRVFSKYADHVITVNHELVQWVFEKLGLMKSKISYLPNFVELDLHNNEINDKRDVPGVKGKRVLKVANFRPEKNHPNLLKAFVMLRRHFPDACLILVGKEFDDKYSHRVRDFITQEDLGNSVFLLGPLTNIEDIIQQCDIGVISSDSEGLPMVLLEYGKMGIPVISTNVGECPQVLGNGQYGVLVPADDPVPLSEALSQLLTDNSMAKEKGLAFQRHIEQNYTPKNVLSSLVRIYQKVSR